jgi:magnesium transporter
MFVDDPKGKVAEIIGKYSYLALPVVDHEGVLRGIVTVDDVLDQTMD